MAPSQSRILSLEQIRETTLAKLGRFPCRWQAHATQVILERKNDLITIAPTGSGKTLTFWMPLLFRADGIQIVVTPLNILGTQNEQELAKFGVRAIAVRAETATPKVFREIREGKYRAIVVSPEELMKVGGGFEDLWNDEGFTSRIMSIVFDEAHCISTWKSFRQDYKNIDRLRYLLPHVPFVLATATLPGEMQREIMKTLQIRADRCTVIRRSNDRPNVHIEVRRIKHSLSGYEDLDFLVLPRTERAAGDLIPKFLVFFDNIDDCMSEQFREDDLAAFNASNLYGLCSTDSFGMGVNVADVRIVVQWRMPRDLNTLWQRFGRAARDLTLNAVAILLVDGRYFDEEKEKKQRAAEKAAEKAAKKRKAVNDPAQKPTKRARTNDTPGTSAATATSSITNIEQQREAASETESADATRPPAGGVSEDQGRGSSQEPPQRGAGVGSQVDLASLRADIEAARLSSRQGGARKGKKTDQETSELSAELDALVNAATRPHRCYRAPIMAYYRNDQIEPDDPPCLAEGCSRCATRAPMLCCILCSPDAPCFAAVAPHECDAAPPQPRASRIKKDTTISPAGRDLRTALDTFRRERTINKYGRALLDNLGASVVLPDNAIDRLVECAQAGKIKSLDDVQREVGKKWGKAREYGEEVAAIIRRIFPLDNPFVVAPLTPRPQPVNAAHVGSSTAPNHSSALATPTPARRTVRQYKCSACGAAGHNKNNRSCPKYASKAQQENAPPTAATAGNADEGPASDTDEQEVQPRRSPLPAPSTVLDTLFTTPSYRRNARVATLEQIRAEQHSLQSPQQQDTVSTPGRAGLVTEPGVNGSSAEALMMPVPPSRFYGSPARLR
ncbi:P-loop containing nucleoside triphosphate hydrolase protein [Fomitopsis serialis]|uniref:P-loop containing nucleoside triphosphate hydrolase protein n=1 Tax=Fomitopsis serialis TaxID=139415 RepID=UPI002008BD9C|nr:P-loop containing nucleoside triphosphate hydrolase protein [Neoantrodia serialis]KAH9929414.1 P-loop containing nucleoside triphosphate hydrolase protein [Neoantrodia serialis]